MSHEAIDHVRQLYAPPDHPVFQWIPPVFEQHAKNFYAQVGGGQIDRSNAWFYYHSILGLFRQLHGGDEVHNELHLQASVQANLRQLSDTGSHRGDAWGYDMDMDLMHEVPEEDYQVDDNDDPTVVFSDEENETIDDVF